MIRSDTNLCPCCKEHNKRKWNKICLRCKKEGQPIPKLKRPKNGVDYPSEYCCYNCYLRSTTGEYRVCSCNKCASVGCKFCDHN